MRAVTNVNHHENFFSVILLAGGIGSRMKMTTPKQFLALGDKALALHSFDLFALFPLAYEIVVVCEEPYRFHFTLPCGSQKLLSFAKPGARRQDSVYNGLQAMKSDCSLVCVHDAARPFVTKEILERTLKAAAIYNAATCATKIKFTLRQTDSQGAVINTPDRSGFWEIQTPQVIKRPLLEDGFKLAMQNNITVTDDVALVELLKKPVQLVEGCYSNIKITTQEDLVIANSFMKRFAK